MARPRKPPGEKRVIRPIRMTDAEVEKVDSAREVEEPRKKLSTYIRDVVIEHAEKVLAKKKK